MVKCECGKELKTITKSHLGTKTHKDGLKKKGITVVEEKPSVKQKLLVPATTSISVDLKSIEQHIMKILTPKFEGLEERLQQIESMITQSPQVFVKTTSVIPTNEFTSLLKAKYDRINQNERRGGMVPIPKLWDEMAKENVSRSQFEKDLFELEKKQIIDLQTASDPALVREKEKSISHPSRGLINYVVWRR